MNIFDVAGENFFKPLTSQFKILYLDCLTIIYDSYRSELSYGIDREILVSKLSDYFEHSNISDIEFEDEAEILKDSRMKATTFLRKLKDFGWVEYEISNNQTARVIMPDHAVSIVKTLLDISNPKEMEYQSEIAVIYSTLTNEELLERPYPQVLRPVFERTRALFDGLKKLNTSIKKYIEDITADKTSEEIIHDFFTYHDEIGSKAYHRIKTEENISRFRNTIIGRLRDILNDPDTFEKTVKGYQNIENENDYYTAEEEVKAQITAIIDSFRSYDDIVSEIDKKHSKYLKNAVERAKFLLLNTNNTEGKISTILQYMAECYNQEEQNNLLEDASDDICSLFNSNDLSKKEKHQKPDGYNCSCDTLTRYSIGHEFQTDVVLLKFVSENLVDLNEAWTILYALLEGLSKCLHIDRTELSGCLHWYRNEEMGNMGNYGFVLFDNTPGGAGYVRQLRNVSTFMSMLEAALVIVSKCTCGGEVGDTACYGCLCNYYNQKQHDILQRRYAVDFLNSVKNGQAFFFGIQLEDEEVVPPADDILTQTAYFNNDGQDQSMMSYDEIWNYLSQDTEDEEQLELIQTIASQMEEGSYDKPHYSASITIVQDETKIIADLVWPASKVLLFLRENVESFEAAQSTNWTSFCLDDDFNIPAFIQKIKR